MPRSNSKEVMAKVKQHVLDYYADYKEYEGANSPEEAITIQVKSMLWGNRMPIEAASDMVSGGSFLIYDKDIEEFLNGLGINPQQKEFEPIATFNLYKHLLSREINKIYQETK